MSQATKPADRAGSGVTCPDCDEPLVFTFKDTSGVGAHKRGDNFNTTPDTDHFVCFSCASAWKQRLSGPVTPDIVGDLAFFVCRHADCGGRLAITHESLAPTDVELTCPRGHGYIVVAAQGGGLALEDD